MRKQGRRLRRAVKRKRAAWARARNERKRTKHAQANLDQLHRDLNEVHGKLQEHPENEALQEKLVQILAAMERTASRRARRAHRLHVWRQRVKFRVKRETILRRKFKAAKAKWEKDHQGAFETWMLNGHSGDIDEDLKPVIAFLVLDRGQAVSDTYDYCCHAASSYHYPRNNSDGEGHAVDMAGPDMCGAATAAIAHFGQGHWLELFSPCPYWIKFGARYPGYFPGHGDHGHYAVA